MLDRDGQTLELGQHPIRFGLRAKIVVGLLTIAMLVVAVGGVGIWAELRINRQADEVSRYSGPALLSVEQMISEAFRLQDKALSSVLLSGPTNGVTATSPSEAELLEAMPAVAEARDAFLTALAQHHSLASRDDLHREIPLHQDTDAAFERYYAAVLDVVGERDPQKIPERVTQLEQAETHLLGILEALFNNESNQLIASQMGLANDADRLVLLNALVILVSLGLAILIALRISSAITSPLSLLQRAAVQIGRGQYLSNANNPLRGIDSRDEIGTLAQAVSRMSGDLQQLNDDLHHAAHHDMLTGLANRKGLVEQLDAAVTRAHQHGETAALLFLDIDRFKVVNDLHGHSAGDELLIAFGARLMSCLRGSDLVARIGGDEFTILLARVDDEEVVLDLTRRLVDTLEQPFQLLAGTVEVRLSASIGVVLVAACSNSSTDILRDADLAMHRAKGSGEGRFELFTEELRAAAMSTMRLESDLRQALEQGALSVHYQPIVEVDEQAPAGLEALARWFHPELGFIPPDRFIAIAEDAGLILELDRTILRQACHQVAEWNAHLGTELSVSVNLSGHQFASNTLIDAVGDILAETGLPPQLLHLEITETILMQRSDQTQHIVQQLKRLGVALHMDDFGTGYSSLAYLHLFDVSTLKIDRSFIARMLESPESGALVSTILAMATALHLQVVAEGVETEAQRAHLQRLGCDYLQGYLISKPLPAREMTEFLTSRLRPPPTSQSLAPGAKP